MKAVEGKHPLRAEKILECGTKFLTFPCTKCGFKKKTTRAAKSCDHRFCAFCGPARSAKLATKVNAYVSLWCRLKQLRASLLTLTTKNVPRGTLEESFVWIRSCYQMLRDRWLHGSWEERPEAQREVAHVREFFPVCRKCRTEIPCKRKCLACNTEFFPVFGRRRKGVPAKCPCGHGKSQALSPRAPFCGCCGTDLLLQRRPFSRKGDPKKKAGRAGKALNLRSAGLTGPRLDAKGRDRGPGVAVRNGCGATESIVWPTGEKKRRKRDRDLDAPKGYVYGGFTALEVTAPTSKNGDGDSEWKYVGELPERGFWHVHIHDLIVAGMIPKEALVRAWFEITDGSSILDIHEVKSVEKGAKEVSKYIVKGQAELMGDAEAFGELLEASEGLRALQGWGCFRGVDADIEAEVEAEIREEREVFEAAELEKLGSCPCCGARAWGAPSVGG